MSGDPFLFTTITEYGAAPNVRIDEDKHGVDDVAISPVESFRLERMDKGYYWIGVYMADGSRHTFQVTSKSRIDVTHREEPSL